MIMMKTVLLLIVALMSTNLIYAQNADQEIKDLLESRYDQIKELMGPEGTEYSDAQRAELKEIINGIIDFEAMAKEALDDTYNTISEEQRTEFVDLFSTIIRDQSLNKLDIYRADVKYEQINVEDSSATVITLAQLEKVRTPVSYEMKFDGYNNKWVVIDMIIDDVSTAGSYQRQFQNI